MAYPRTIRGFNSFLGGTSYFGLVVEATLPSLTLVTEDHRGAGMDQAIAIDMGMERMTCDISFAEHRSELVTRLGTKDRLVLRPAQVGEDSFEADSYVFTVGARWTAVEPGKLKQGTLNPLILKGSVDYYRIELNGAELVEIDVVNAVRKIGGADQLASIRKAMGL